MEKAGKKQTFYYDNSISILEEEGAYHYYLNDELGSPVRVSGYGGEETAGISNYHSYGYDEFGNDLSEALTEAGILSSYTEQGEYQPFGYTGYRYDTISSTFFAQAREYQPRTGRFTAEDVIKGNGLVPETLNPYAYCFNNPLMLVDLDGLLPAWLDGIYAHSKFSKEFNSLYNKKYGVIATDRLYGRTSVFIPRGGRYGINGYADAMLYTANSVEVYEIKPISHYDNPILREKGEEQLKKYTTTYKETYSSVSTGDREHIEYLLDHEYVFNYKENTTITYRMFEDSPGMIYYEISNKEEGERAPAVETVIVPREITEVEQVGLAVIFLSILGSLKDGAVAVANGLFAPIIMFDEILEQYLRRFNKCTHEDEECTCDVV